MFNYHPETKIGQTDRWTGGPLHTTDHFAQRYNELNLRFSFRTIFYNIYNNKNILLITKTNYQFVIIISNTKELFFTKKKSTRKND